MSSANGGLSEQVKQAQETWDTIDLSRVRYVAWLSLSAVGRSIWSRFGNGHGPHEFVRFILSKRGAARNESLRGAALVCGDMEGERGFFDPWDGFFFSEVHGWDISAESLARVQPGPYLFVAHQEDCNQLELPTRSFNLIVVNHGAHHVFDLNRFFGQARNSLSKAGALYFYEWIGPRFLQIPRRNQFFARLFLVLLFSRRNRLTHMGKRKGLCYLQDPPESFDPSEACNSMEIIPEVDRYFDRVEVVFHGGLAYPIFEGIAQNLDAESGRHRRRIAFVLAAERILTKLGLVYPLFAVGVVVPRQDTG